MTSMILTKVSRRFTVAYTIAAMLFSGILGSHAAAQPRVRDEAKTITLGIVAERNPQQVEEHFREFVRYVARKLSTTSAIEGRIAMAPTQAKLAGLLTERKADFYMESSHPTYLINSVYGSGKLLLRRWKGGAAEYHALIFAHRSGLAKRLEDIRGKLIAFEDPGSTSGHFLPKYFLLQKGFKLSQKSQLDAIVSPGEVGYIFAYSQDKLVDLVQTKKVAAGAFSNEDFNALDGKKKAEIVILAQTDKLPRHMVSVRKDLSTELVTRLEKILLSMDQDPEGRSILQRTDATTKFDALPGGELAMRQRLLDVYHYSESK